MHSIERRRARRRKKNAKRVARKAKAKYEKQQLEHQENRIGRSMEETLELGMRVHERLEQEQRALARISAARKRMDAGFLPSGFQFAGLPPIDAVEARDMMNRWKAMFPEVSRVFLEADYATIEERVLASMPEGVSPYGLPLSTQEEASSQQSGQKSDKAG